MEPGKPWGPPFWEVDAGGGPITEWIEARRSTVERRFQINELIGDYRRLKYKALRFKKRKAANRCDESIRQLHRELNMMAYGDNRLWHERERVIKHSEGKPVPLHSWDFHPAFCSSGRHVPKKPSLDHYDRQAGVGEHLAIPILHYHTTSAKDFLSGNRYLPGIQRLNSTRSSEEGDQEGQMSASLEEQQTRDLLKTCGAVYVRKSGNSHEVWRLPNGITYTCDARGRGRKRTWKNHLAELKRMLDGVVTHPESSQPVITDAEAEAALARNKRKRNKKRRSSKSLRPVHPNMVASPPARPREAQPLRQEPTTKEISMPASVTPIRKPDPEPETARDKYFGQPYTEAQEQVIREGVDEGMSWEDIAILLQDERPGVTAGAIKQKAAKMGLTGKRPKKAKRTRKAISSGVQWDSDESKMALDMYHDGATYRDMSEAINAKFSNGRTHGSISAHLNLLKEKGLVDAAQRRRAVYGESDSAPAPEPAKESTEAAPAGSFKVMTDGSIVTDSAEAALQLSKLIKKG